MKKLTRKIAGILTAAAVAFSAVTLPNIGLLPGLAITANAETTTSTVNVGGTDYTLFTSFTATGGSTGTGVFTYDKAVDGDMSSSWHDMSNGVYVEFNSDDPIIPKGYIFNTYMAGNFYPEDWVLKAKANTDDDWITLSSYSGQTLSSGQEFQYACSNNDNTAYKYFRFEASNTNNNIWLTEIRLYGFENLTYTHLTETTATCTEVGIKQECYRRSDGKYFTDETGATELAESDVIEPMIAHTGVHHAADEDHIEYWQCSMCGKYFSDSDCSAEITEAQTQALRYLDENGDTQTLDTDKTIVTSATKSWSNGWYVVYDDVTISDRITVSGTVNLILCNGATLTASKGITVGSNNTLNIYAQTDDEATMGTLVADATSETDCAGIGGVSNAHPNCGTIVINGGKITANGNEAGIGGGGYQSTNGNITINGGIVNATAGSYSYSAGIGGGNSGYVASVTLNGGIITATGDTQYRGAGIGTGAYAGSGTMTITIGSGVKKLVATKGYNSDCIGKESNASTTVNVVFKNGETTVEGDDKDAVFYDTGEGSVRQIRAKAMNHAVTMSNDLKANITANPEYALAGETVTLTLGAAVDASTLRVNDGTSDLTLTDAGNRQYTFTMPDGNVTVTATAAQSYAVTLPANMEVVSATNAADANGKYITGTTVTFKASFPYAASDVSDGTNTLEPDANGVYSVTVATADITITATVGRSATIDLTDATGDFTAIDNDVLTGTTAHTVTITDGASITLNNATITGGIVCEGTAEITLVGTNSTTGKYGKAGIQIGGSGTTLTINGDGSLTANGGYNSAGIGLSRAWDVTEDVIGGNIVINGGNITANGGVGAAGIGAGFTKGPGNSSERKAIVGNITIKGGTVTAVGVKAVGGNGADGIGAGDNVYNATYQIGTVTIYDDIDKVDASSIKDFANVVYMHGESNVTASKTDYFTIGEDSNRRLIVQKPVIAEIAEQAYTGSAVTPEPQVTIGSLNLTKGTDYVYSYTNNTNFGTATVRATFQGDYASLGYVEKEFTILPPPVVVNVTGNGTVTYNDKSAASGETIGVTAEKGTDVTLTLTPENGYAVRSVEYGYTNSNEMTMNGAKLPINGTTATLTVPNDLKDGTYVNLTVTFVSALAGGADEASAVALTDNTVTDLAGGWYKVDSDITFDHTLNLLGDTHLIIDDGKTMTVNTASGKGIDSEYTLTVSGEGALSVTTTAGYGIAVVVRNYVQTDATVSASGYIGIRCTDDFIAFNFDNDFTFSGGQLTATGSGGGGIWADNDITLGYTNASDFIQSSSYNGTIKVADGKMFKNGSDEYSGTLSNNDIAGKKLVPVTGTITVTPVNVDGGDAPVNMEGTQTAVYGSSVTLTAPSALDKNYNFVGWYEHTNNGDTLLRSSNEYTFTVTENICLYAKYKAFGNATLTIDGGSSFTINGDAKSTSITADYTLGTSITVATETDKFAYWKNSYGMILSRSASYTFTVTGADTITAVFDTVVENKATLVFESAYGQVMAREQLAEGGSMEIPSLPYRNGYTALGWDMNGDGEYNADDTLAAAITRGLAATNNMVVISPVYELKNVTYTITVTGGTGGGTYNQNDKVTVTANAPESGYKFSHWQDGEETILGYNTTYQFFADRDLTLTAVFVADTVVVEAVGTTEIISTSKDATAKTLTFVSMSSVPEGFTIKKAGIIATNVIAIGTSETDFVAENAIFVRGNPWNGDAYRYTWTKGKLNIGDTWYVRAYLVYEDANGNSHEVYGDIVSQTL